MLLTNKVKNYIHAKKLFNYGDKLVIGVSGGADSIALLHILHELKHSLGIYLIVAHYNHNLRKESKKDELFVHKQAHQLNIPFYSDSWETPEKRNGGSLEQICREKRLKFFHQIMKKVNAQRLVLAHHKDDLAETVMMRIIRGSGLQGLRGILPHATINKMDVVRPLLNVSKNDIKSYLKNKKIPFREDKTNKETVFFRNKIRLKLIPLLEKEYNNQIKDALINLAENADIDYSYIKKQTDKKLEKMCSLPKASSIKINTYALKKEDPAIIRLIIRQSIERLMGNTNSITMRHVKDIENLLKENKINAVVHLPKNIKVQHLNKHLIISSSKTK